MSTLPKLRVPPIEDGSNSGEYSSPACYLHEFESGRMPDAALDIQIKRIYDPTNPTDGCRVLVDRLWPRGIGREQAALDTWARSLAPSTPLRKWLYHSRERWGEFCTRYREELREHAKPLEVLRQRARKQRVTLLYAAQDKQINHAVVLRDALLESCSSPQQLR